MRPHTFAFPLALTALLFVSGCASDGQATPSPSPTSAVASDTKPPYIHRSTETEAPSEEPTPSPTTTTAKPAPKPTTEAPTKTSFTGVTPLGEQVTFEILPADAQDYLNNAVSGTGLKGSWAAQCSTEMTANQIGGDAVETTEANGGHTHRWLNVRTAASQIAPTELDRTETENIDAYAAGHAQGKGVCIAMHTPLTSAARQGYDKAEIGLYYRNEIHNPTTLK